MMEITAHLDRITRDPGVMGGQPCIRGMRVTVGMVAGLVAGGHSHEAILAAYPYLEEEDIRQALATGASVAGAGGWGQDGFLPEDYFTDACGFSREEIEEGRDPLPEAVGEAGPAFAE